MGRYRWGGGREVGGHGAQGAGREAGQMGGRDGGRLTTAECKIRRATVRRF